MVFLLLGILWVLGGGRGTPTQSLLSFMRCGDSGHANRFGFPCIRDKRNSSIYREIYDICGFHFLFPLHPVGTGYLRKSRKSRKSISLTPRGNPRAGVNARGDVAGSSCPSGGEPRQTPRVPARILSRAGKDRISSNGLIPAPLPPVFLHVPRLPIFRNPPRESAPPHSR